MARSFTAQLKDFEDLTTRNMRYVASSAIQDVVEAAQTPQRGVTKGGTFETGKIPVAEGDLINSLSVDGGAKGQDAYVVALAGFELGDVMRFAWIATHALPMEVGYTTSTGRQVPGRHYVGANAARFPEFVKRRAAEVRK